MANSTRNGAQLQPSSEMDLREHELAETAEGKDGPTGESGSVLETPSLWHAGPRGECWTSSSIMKSGSWGSPFAAPGRPAFRLRRPPRRRTVLHCSRPFQEAEARFISPRSELLTD